MDNEWTIDQRVTVEYPADWVNMPKRVGRIVKVTDDGFIMITQPQGQRITVQLDAYRQQGVMVRGWDRKDGWPADPHANKPDKKKK